MTTIFRALCAEALNLFEGYDSGERVDWDHWKEVARAALDGTEPERFHPISLSAEASEKSALDTTRRLQRALERTVMELDSWHRYCDQGVVYSDLRPQIRFIASIAKSALKEHPTIDK